MMDTAKPTRGAVLSVRKAGLNVLRSPVPTIPMAGIVLLIFLAIFGQLVETHDPTRNRIIDSMIAPAWAEGGSSEHLLGTDRFGRDQFSRLVRGARISVVAAASVIGIGALLGTIIGLIAGYYDGRWFSTALMRAVDITLAFPAILMAMVLATILHPSFTNVILVISLLIWPRFARQIRGEVLGIRLNDYVTYSVVSGETATRIMLKHILPNVVPTLLVLITLQVGYVILLEASLSFLGVGIPPPAPSWGLMVSDGRGQLSSGWWISLFPGLAIMLTVLCMNTVGDWLRDKWDPKLRQL